jgi:Negative regulator of beta-lactamase expression
MRNIKHLVVHCTATKAGQKVTVEDVDKWHKARGWRKIGYHYLIYLDGTIKAGRDENEVGAHVAGNNSTSIGICYVGGLDATGKPTDTRTENQKAALFYLMQRLKTKYPTARIVGHRDFSPDLNGNGIIEPWEYMKACPCFDAAVEYKNL